MKHKHLIIPATVVTKITHSMPHPLTAAEANRISITQMTDYIKLLTQALSYTFDGKSMLFGKEVDEHTLAVARKQLVELDRKQQIYDSAKYHKLPYLNSNGGVDNNKMEFKKDDDGNMARTFVKRGDKVKAHLNKSGTVNFIEVTKHTKSKGVQSHVNSKGLVRKQLSTFSKNNKTKSFNEANTMATTKAKKPSKQTLKASKQPYAVKGKTNAERIREAYNKNPKTFNVTEFAAKSGIPYNLVYGCVSKEKVKGTSKKNNSKPVTKKKAAAAKA